MKNGTPFPEKKAATVLIDVRVGSSRKMALITSVGHASTGPTINVRMVRRFMTDRIRK